MRKPSFQFYPADWLGNANLRRCSHVEKGIWMDVLCLMHDAEEYGILRWTLKDLAKAVGCKIAELQSLQAKGVLKGADRGERCASFVFAPRHAGKDGEAVVLIPEQDGPLWYSSRMIRDEHVRQRRGAVTRFEDEPKGAPKPSPKSPIGGAELDEEESKKKVNAANDAMQQKLCTDFASHSNNETLDSPKPPIGGSFGDGPSSSTSSSSKNYRYFGETVRLNEADYLRLKTTYSAIPDFDAELGAADRYYTGKRESGWYFALDGWLNRTHQTHYGRHRPDVPWNETPGNRMPSPAGG